ncbi:uncharacterized protein PV09_02855 [Verruconis gallopava]|uniref:Uncharacterized protein n=1 Tax=Verruconis gallopava TaxID=253628 RepID=A0A0D1Z0B1_9PEZI|nr:uncharacterized protein PV09_02855 [Verruconis gallopava]KIW06402.1 hypothetical protein PV09_02855 [Verruconis gallopava]
MTAVPPAMRLADAKNGCANSPLPSPTKSPRRVLGELTPNTKITPKPLLPGAKSPVKTTPVNSPFKAPEVLSESSILLTSDQSDVSSSGISKKRPFSAISSPEKRDATRKRQQDMPPQTVSPAALGSPLPPPTPAIELPEQRPSVEKDEVVETSSEHDDAHIELPTAAQRTNGSFSSLIDYNPDNASDRSDPATVSSPPLRPTSIPVTSRVELLKLRLKMAMYKINTNQTFVPFSKLEPPHTRTPIEAAEETEDLEEDAEYASSVQTVRTRGESNSGSDGELQTAKMTSDNIVITGGPVAKLLDGPVLVPTAFSTRFLVASESPASPTRRTIERSIDQQRTPATSPSRKYVGEESELTSSVVKGHAASGLLELAQSR